MTTASSQEPEALGGDAQAALLALARRAVGECLDGGSVASTGTPQDDMETVHALQAPGAAFVTLREGRTLRGCIGTLRWDRPLAQVVRDMAVRAATADPRFPPVKAHELDGLSVEISILSQPTVVAGPQDVTVGRHGCIIRKGSHTGLLLPQVARDLGWSAEELVEHTCQKAGLAVDSWRDPETTIEVFMAHVFKAESAR